MTEVDQPYPIPEHWCWKRLDEVGEVKSGSTPSTSEDENFGGDVPWLTPNDLSEFKGKYVRRGERNLTKRGLDACSAVLLPSDTVLFSSRAPIGYVAIAENPIATNQGFKNLIPGDTVESDYVFHYLKANTALAESYASGTTFKELSATRFSRIPIPVPPRVEQRQIVSRIEQLLSNLDNGLESLQAANRQLERYRLSVLQAAIVGRLTKEWRRSHSPESAHQLLDRILEERRGQWEDDYRMRKYTVKGKEPPTGWRERYDSPKPPKDEPRRPLPDDWRWVTVDQLSPNIHYGYTESATEEAVGPRFLRISDIQDGKVNWDDVPYCEIGESERKKYLLSPGDIVFARTGGTVGKSYLVRDDVPEAVFASYLIRVITVESFEEDYLYLFFQSLDYWRQISERKTGIGQPNVNATKLSELVLPLPPLPEQRRIVDEVERLLSVSEDGLNTVSRETDRANKLRQSILRKAFSGRLL